MLELTESSILLRVTRSGSYRLAVRYSPYWRSSIGCVTQARDGMIRLALPQTGVFRLQFAVNADAALNSLAGNHAHVCRG